jgi:cyclomaltodextrinase
MAGVEWFRNAVVYHIMIDRFAGCGQDGWNEPKFLGGNLKGVASKLPYLKKLGVNTVWLSPFCRTSAYHGYHVTDYYDVDPHFGTKQDLVNLVRRAHKMKMRVIADFVPNHCSREHPFFQSALKDKNSPYRKWFYFTRWPGSYMCFLDFEDLPKLNLEYEPAREHIIGAAKHWLKLGIDGFRLDHVVGPKHEFWQVFRQEVKKEYPNAVLIGEAWIMGIKFGELKTINTRFKTLKWLFGAAPDTLLKEYVGELDGVLDFGFQSMMKNYVAKKAFWRPGWLLRLKLRLHYSRYPKSFFLPSFLDNHDMNRFLFECGGDKALLKEAARLQLSLSQPPIIYYGTEVGMTQLKPMEQLEDNADLQARRPMRWENQDEELLKFYRKMIEERRSKRI